MISAHKRMKKMLIKIEKITDYIFCEVLDGKITFLATEEKIPISLITDKDVPKDGFYSIHKITCDGVCRIGFPLEKCKNTNKYHEGRCATYHLCDARDRCISIGEIEKL